MRLIQQDDEYEHRPAVDSLLAGRPLAAGPACGVIAVGAPPASTLGTTAIPGCTTGIGAGLIDPTVGGTKDASLLLPAPGVETLDDPATFGPTPPASAMAPARLISPIDAAPAPAPGPINRGRFESLPSSIGSRSLPTLLVILTPPEPEVPSS